MISEEKEQEVPDTSHGNEEAPVYADAGCQQEIVTTSNNISETSQTEMEVYHPHRIKHNKRIVEIVFEFFMLFLAITGGFLMENLREKAADKRKEKEYIINLVKDIENDTASLGRLININVIQNSGIDSLLMLTRNAVPDNKLEKMYEQTYRFVNTYHGFDPRDLTIEQMKNTGGLRLIERKEVLDSINVYYSKIERYSQLNAKMYQNMLDDIIDFEMGFLDFTYMQGESLKRPDSEKMHEFRNRVFAYNSCITWQIAWLGSVKKKGASLLSYLKHEYNLEE